MKLLILSSLVFVIGATLSNSNCADELPLAVDDNQDSTIEHIVKGSFDFEGRARYYEVFLPEDYSRSANLPLMIYLHAYDWNPSIGMDYTRMNMLADTSGYIVVCPSAINRRWNSGIADNPNWPTPDVNDVGFINALIDTLDYNFSIDLERIYACGFSNGGYMSYKLACQLSHRIAAIASVGGIISTGTVDECNSQHAMPVLQIHGTMDNIVPIDGITGWHSVEETIGFWSDFNDCVQVDTVQLPDLDLNDGCTVEKISLSNCSSDSKIVFYKVLNGGHSWPGATTDYSWAGNRNLDINASVEIWDFFKNYKLIQ